MNERAESRPLIQPQHPRDGAQPQRIRKQREDQAAERAVRKRPPDVPLQLRTRGLDEAVVLNAGRTGREAGHAAEARVEMTSKALVPRRAALQCGAHQVDAASRRVRFFAPYHVGRACRQTEAAMNAVVDELARWWMCGVEDRCGGCAWHSVIPAGKHATPRSPGNQGL